MQRLLCRISKLQYSTEICSNKLQQIVVNPITEPICCGNGCGKRCVYYDSEVDEIYPILKIQETPKIVLLKPI